jgi:hypothetical protein
MTGGRTTLRALALALAAALGAGPRAARAEQPPSSPRPPPAAPSGAPAAPGPARAEAPSAAALEAGRAHFQRGIEFFKEGDYRAALVEFKRSYDTAPSYRILYNIAQSSTGLQDYAGALRAFERYLSEGGAEIDAERRAQVQAEVRRLRARVATVEIDVNVPGAEVFVDDVPVGHAPLKGPVLVSAGMRRFGASKPPAAPVSRVVELVGGDSRRVSLALVDPEAASKAPDDRPAGGPRPAPSWPSGVPFWASLAATGALGAGTAVVGVLALQERRSLDDAFEGYDVDTIDSVRSRARALAVTTDVLGVATVVAGGVTAYFAVRSYRRAVASPPPPAVGLGLGPRGATLRVAFLTRHGRLISPARGCPRSVAGSGATAPAATASGATALPTPRTRSSGSDCGGAAPFKPSQPRRPRYAVGQGGGFTCVAARYLCALRS